MRRFFCRGVSRLTSRKVTPARWREKDTHLGGVVADLADHDGRKSDLSLANDVGANGALLSLDAKRSELLEEPVGHALDILDVAGKVSPFPTTNPERRVTIHTRGCPRPCLVSFAPYRG
jgi:hypothetical protein